MGKLILASLLLATVVLPMRAARGRAPRRGFGRLLLSLAAFNLMYLLAVLYLIPRLR